jgi:drug/metabolite transporter (DMT)-like permease
VIAPDTRRAGDAALIAAAPVLFVVLWGSGFPITKFGLEYIEPFTLLAIRSGLNVAVVLAIMPFFRIRWPANWREAGHIAVSGFLLQFAYLGAMFTALGGGVSQGVAALAAGMQPLLTAAVVGPLLGERIVPRQWAGFVLGFGGLACVMSERIAIAEATAIGFAAAACTPILITAGSLYQKRFCADMDLRSGMVIQHLTAGAASAVVAFSIETREVDWGFEIAIVLAWLVVLLSVVAVNLYFMMLRRGQAARVSSLFYLTPPTAAVLGYLTYGEVFGWFGLAGFAIAVIGVALASRGGK